MASGPYERFYPGEDRGLVDPTSRGGPYRLSAPSISQVKPWHVGVATGVSAVPGLLGVAGYGANLGYQGIVRGGQALDIILPALKTLVKRATPVWGEGLLDYGAGKQTEKEVERVIEKVKERREPLFRHRTGISPQLVSSGLTGTSLYSRAIDAVINAKIEKGTVPQWISELGRGGGERELNKTGGLDALRKARGVLTKREVLGLLQPYTIKLNETYYTSAHRAEGRFPEPRYAGEADLNLQGYQPGNPVEIVLSLPERMRRSQNFQDTEQQHWPGVINPVVHVRGNDGVLFGFNRLPLDQGEEVWGKAFIVQEIQGNWAQLGNAIGFLDSDGNQTPVTPIQAKRFFEISDEDWGNILPHQQQAYAEEMDNLVLNQPPDMPYKKDWHELGFKRALMEALRDGSKRYLAWTTGEAQAKRNYGENWEVDFPRKAKFPLQLYNEKIVRFAKKFLGVTPQRYDRGKWVVFDPTTGAEIEYFDSEQEADDYTEREYARSRNILDHEKSDDELWYIKITDEMRDKYIKVLEEELGAPAEVQMPTAQVEGGGLLGRYA